MKKKIVQSALLGAILLNAPLSAMEFEWSVGVHDFMVMDIKDDDAHNYPHDDGISAGDSHTLGINTAIYVKHTTQTGINIVAKAEAFLDHDKDHLDPDHIPVWFDFSLDVDGDMYSINDANTLRWYIALDNRQNTVSCVEREVRQHLGVGYEFNKSGFTFDAKILAGFYYIEFDDDTPVARGYNREETDDGEASHVYVLRGAYKFNKDWSVEADFRHYAANTGGDTLEDNANALLTYKGSDMFGEGTTMNLKVKHVKYDISRLNVHPLPIVPFDNDTLIQAYVTIPVEF